MAEQPGANIDLGDDDGMVEVKVGGAVFTLDLWKTDAAIYDFFERTKSAPVAQTNDQLVDLIEGLGLPRLSHKLALKFARSVGEAVTSAKKNDSPTAGSPASTG